MFFLKFFKPEKYKSNLILQLFIVYLNKITIIAVLHLICVRFHIILFLEPMIEQLLSIAMVNAVGTYHLPQV